MRLEHLYRIRFTYPGGWAVDLDRGWQQHFYPAEGGCEGTVTGRFHGANHPVRRGPDGPFCPDLRGVIETDDNATVMFECHGYGRAYPAGRRQIVGSAVHVSDSDRYRRLNDVVCVCVCVCVGEVRSSSDPAGQSPEIVMDVAELIWEPIAG